MSLKRLFSSDNIRVLLFISSIIGSYFTLRQDMESNIANVRTDIAVLTVKVDNITASRNSNLITMTQNEKKYDMCCDDVTRLKAIHNL